MLRTIRQIIDRAGSHKRRLYWGFLWEFIHTGFLAMPIMGAAFLLHRMLQYRQGEAELDPIWAVYALVFMVVAVAGRFVFSYLRSAFQDLIGYEMAAAERVHIGTLLKRVSLGFFDKHNTGKIAGAVTTEMT